MRLHLCFNVQSGLILKIDCGRMECGPSPTVSILQMIVIEGLKTKDGPKKVTFRVIELDD